MNREKRKEPLFLPSDLSNLKDLTGLVKLRNYDYVLSQWTYETPLQNQPGFLIREDLSLTRIKEEQDRLKRQVNEIKIDFSGLDIEGEASGEDSDDVGRPAQMAESFINSGGNGGGQQATAVQDGEPKEQRAASRPVIIPTDNTDQPKVKEPVLLAGLNDLRGWGDEQ